jgi:hypothetical protein
MITSATSHNFQANKHIALEFHPGINLIVGSTDNGKSAFIRNLYWTCFNRPLGDDYISFWNRNKSGNPIEETSGSITRDTGHTVKRIRSSVVNGYQIDDNPVLEAIGRGEPPIQVTEALQMSEVNFSMQDDLPFLISESPGNVARMLNSIIRLDVIDSVITMAKKKKSDIKNDLVVTQKTMAEVTEKANQFSWLEDAKTLLSKAEGLQKDINAIAVKKARLASLYASIQENKRKQTIFQALYAKITPYIERMDVLQEDLSQIKRKKDRLLTMKTTITQQKVNVKTLTAQRDEIQKTLPPICPECGKAL